MANGDFDLSDALLSGVSQAFQQAQARKAAEDEALVNAILSISPTVQAQGPAAPGQPPPTASNPAFDALIAQREQAPQQGLLGGLLGGVNRLIPGLETGGRFDATQLNPTAPAGLSSDTLRAIAEATESNRALERAREFQETGEDLEQRFGIQSEFGIGVPAPREERLSPFETARQRAAGRFAARKEAGLPAEREGTKAKERKISFKDRQAANLARAGFIRSEGKGVGAKTFIDTETGQGFDSPSELPEDRKQRFQDATSATGRGEDVTGSVLEAIGPGQLLGEAFAPASTQVGVSEGQVDPGELQLQTSEGFDKAVTDILQRVQDPAAIFDALEAANGGPLSSEQEERLNDILDQAGL